MMSEERIAELRSLPDRELLDEILRIAGFEKANISDFRGAINP